MEAKKDIELTNVVFVADAIEVTLEDNGKTVITPLSKDEANLAPGGCRLKVTGQPERMKVTCEKDAAVCKSVCVVMVEDKGPKKARYWCECK